jgi:Fe-Mn family superoxide dismutase
MKHELPKLPYDYSALEPFIDTQTMTIHHAKHHQAYTDKFNAALEGHADLQQKSAEEIIKNLDSVPESIRAAVRNHGGGYVNHAFFWTIMKNDKQSPQDEIAEAISRKFGSFDKFKEQFSASAATLFGSGWAWLVASNDQIEITTTSNQDSPLTVGKIPLLTIDVWEHAYYLKYQNRRPEYIAAFFNVINWEKVNEHFKNAMK